jgi:hypothetical protein
VSKSNYLKYKEAGTCIRCGAERANGKSRCERCHELHLGYQHKAKAKHKADGLCHSCGKEPRVEGRVNCDACAITAGEREAQRYKAMREKVLIMYGRACNCCGSGVEKYLQLDHINNDGAEHRKEVLSVERGGSFWAWASRNYHPEILQLLCANCHQAKTIGSPCTQEDHEMMHKAVVPNGLRND